MFYSLLLRVLSLTVYFLAWMQKAESKTDARSAQSLLSSVEPTKKKPFAAAATAEGKVCPQRKFHTWHFCTVPADLVFVRGPLSPPPLFLTLKSNRNIFRPQRDCRATGARAAKSLPGGKPIHFEVFRLDEKKVCRQLGQQASSRAPKQTVGGGGGGI